MRDAKQVIHQVTIASSPELAFEALTAPSELREWLADQAWTEVRPGGLFEVRWLSGYRAQGKFIAVEAPKRVALTWHATDEPGPTSLEFTLEPAEAGVRLTLVHGGFGSGDEWDQALSQSERVWAANLENLKSTLETGIDLRWARKPFLGITFDVIDSARAAKEGIAVEHGIYLTETVEGSGARAAGLCKGDVIVAIAGQETPGFPELVSALGSHFAGDVVDVEIVRGQKRETVQVTLGQRPQQDTAATAEELADWLAGQYCETDAALQSALEGVSDEQACQRPAKDEWSALEVLAHLSITERDQHCYLAIFATHGWLETGGGDTSVLSNRIDAILSTEPTLGDMLNRFLADEAETVAFVRRLPSETVAHKARFRRIGQAMLGLPEHTREHIEQIKATLAAVRAG